jgi:hypothetical protein
MLKIIENFGRADGRSILKMLEKNKGGMEGADQL